MSISQTTNWLNRPDHPERTSLDAEAYMRSRNQSLAHQMILAEFRKSGISQAELAKRTGKGPDIISRLIGRPGNWTLNTLSDLLFAMSAAAPSYSVSYPLSVTPANQTRPAWADQDLEKLTKTTKTNNPLPEPADIKWEKEGAAI